MKKQQSSTTDGCTLFQYSWKSSKSDLKGKPFLVKTSLFDEPNENARTSFQIFQSEYIINRQKLINSQISGILSKALESKDTFQSRKYLLVGSNLFRVKEENFPYQEPKNTLKYDSPKNKDNEIYSLVSSTDVENMRLERIKTKNDKYGFRLSLNGKWIELFCNNQEEAIMWYNQLKKFCTLVTFSEDFSSLNLIGKGNFSRVFSAKMNNFSSTENQKVIKSTPLIPDWRNSNDFINTGVNEQTIEQSKYNPIFPQQGDTERAIKAFKKYKIQSKKEERLSLIKELKILRKLNHSNVLGFCEVYENETHILLVSELLKGGEFIDSLENRQKYDEDLCKAIIYQLLRGLEYLKSLNLLHRDIKPENLLFRNKLLDYQEITSNLDSLVIADFGLADFYQKDGNYMFKRCGTPGYTAPELLADQSYCYKVDTFSAGLMMYLLLTKKQAFEGGDCNDIMMQNYKCEINFSTLKSGQKISSNCLDLLKKLLQKDPNKRISAHDALNHPFFISIKELKYRRDKNREPSQILSFCDINAIPVNSKLMKIRSQKSKEVQRILTENIIGSQSELEKNDFQKFFTNQNTVQSSACSIKQGFADTPKMLQVAENQHSNGNSFLSTGEMNFNSFTDYLPSVENQLLSHKKNSKKNSPYYQNSKIANSPKQIFFKQKEEWSQDATNTLSIEFKSPEKQKSSVWDEFEEDKSTQVDEEGDQLSDQMKQIVSNLLSNKIQPKMRKRQILEEIS